MVTGPSLSLHPLFSGGGRLVWESVGMADLLSDHLDSKQSRESVDLPSLTTFAFRSSEVRCLLIDLDPYCGTDPLSMFPFVLDRIADVMIPVLV